MSVAEIRLGIAFDGQRKQLLADLAEAMFQADFPESCLPFDFSAAAEYASIVAARTRQGRPISVEDAQLAIARADGLTLATRNTTDFAGIDGLILVNPWNDGPSSTIRKRSPQLVHPTTGAQIPVELLVAVAEAGALRQGGRPAATYDLQFAAPSRAQRLGEVTDYARFGGFGAKVDCQERHRI